MTLGMKTLWVFVVAIAAFSLVENPGDAFVLCATINLGIMFGIPDKE